MSGHIEPLRIIEFDERPALDHATASEQLEHLYIHMGLVQEKVNEIVAALNGPGEPRQGAVVNTELRESLREIGYILYRDTSLKWLVRKLGMKPKHWIVEREQRDAHNTGKEPQ